MSGYKFSPSKIFFGMTQFTPTKFDSKKVYICDTGVLGGDSQVFVVFD